MNGPPDWLRLVHVGVFRADGDTLHNVLLVQLLTVLLCELKDLVGLPLLRRLVLLQVFNFRTVIEELLQDVRLPANVVDIRWVLRLALVEHLQNLALRVPTSASILISLPCSKLKHSNISRSFAAVSVLVLTQSRCCGLSFFIRRTSLL